MPFNEYEFVAEIDHTLPRDREQRIRKLFEVHSKLTEQYGVSYREINRILGITRAWSTEEAGPGEPIGDARLMILRDVEQVRTDAVLLFKQSLARAEFLLNELIPGVFPVDVDVPVQSGDIDGFKLGASIVALGGAISVGGCPLVGAPMAAFGAGMMAADALYDWIWDD